MLFLSPTHLAFQRFLAFLPPYLFVLPPFPTSSSSAATTAAVAAAAATGSAVALPGGVLADASSPLPAEKKVPP